MNNNNNIIYCSATDNHFCPCRMTSCYEVNTQILNLFKSKLYVVFCSEKQKKICLESRCNNVIIMAN